MFIKIAKVNSKKFAGGYLEEQFLPLFRFENGCQHDEQEE